MDGSHSARTWLLRKWDYFRRHFEQGAPWTFVVQNNAPHCCIINAKALVLTWLEAVVVRQVKADSGRWGYIRTTPSTLDDCLTPRPRLSPPCHSSQDTWSGTNWNAAAARIGSRRDRSDAWLPAGWLPTGTFARQWRQFVTRSAHPLTSMI